MTRNGKIARLPRHLRDELNQRLDDGEQGKDLVQWLNGLEEVKDILASDFAGRPVNEQNLSDWKQGGFRDWQRQQERSDSVRRLVEQSDCLDDAADEHSIPDRLAAVLAAELAAEAQALLEETADPRERWQYLRQALRQVHLLRKAGHRAARARMEMARWEIECEQREREQRQREATEAIEAATAPLRDAARRKAMVAAYGGGAEGEKAADFILEIERKYSVATFARSFSGQPSPPSNQARSR
jgi:hypothetical protein